MNPQTLAPLKNVPLDVLKAWVAGYYAEVGRNNHPQDTVLRVLEHTAPAQVPDPTGAANDVFGWMQEQRMLLSMDVKPTLKDRLFSQATATKLVGLNEKGVAFANQLPKERLDKSRAWTHIEDLMARVRHHNLTGDGPKVMDVLLFGSMQDPRKTTFGDADLVVVFEQRQGHDPKDLLASLKAGDKFLSLDAHTFFVAQLAEQNPEFCLTSLTGKVWNTGSLGRAADMDASAVMCALHNTPAAWAEHVQCAMGGPVSQWRMNRQTAAVESQAPSLRGAPSP